MKKIFKSKIIIISLLFIILFNPYVILFILENSAYFALEHKKYKLAENLYKAGIPFFYALKKASQAKSLENIGGLFYTKRQFKIAKDFYERAISILEEQKDYEKLFEVFELAYNSNLSIKDMKGAEKILLKKLSLYEESKISNNNFAHYMALSRIQSFYKILGKYNENEQIEYKALAIAKLPENQIPTDLGKIKLCVGWQLSSILFDLTKTNFILGNIDEAEKKYQEALKNKIGKGFDYVFNSNKAKYLFYIGDYRKSGELYSKNISKYPLIYNLDSILGDYYKLFTIYKIQNENEKIEKLLDDLTNRVYTYHFCKNKPICKNNTQNTNCEPLDSKNECLEKPLKVLAFIEKKMGNYNEAEKYYKNVLLIKKQSPKWGKNSFHESISKTYYLENLASLYKIQQKYNLAEKYYKNALEEKLSIDSNFSLCTLNKLKSLYKIQNKDQEIADIKKQQQEIIEKAGFKENFNLKLFCL